MARSDAPLARFRAFGGIVMLLVLAAALGYTLGMFSEAGVPEGVARGARLQRAGGGMFIAAGLATFTCAWYLPRMFLALPFGLGAGFVALVATRVEIHAPGTESPYLIACILSIATFSGAMIGSIAGALGSQMFGGRKAAQQQSGEEPAEAEDAVSRLAVVGKWIAVSGFLTPCVLLPFASSTDLSLPALISAVLTPLLVVSGLLIAVIGNLRKKSR